MGLKLDPDPWQENVEARLAGIKGRMRGRSPLWAPVRGESRPGNPVTLLESRLQITPLRPVLVPTQPNQVTPIADPFL